jgi:transposase
LLCKNTHFLQVWRNWTQQYSSELQSYALSAKITLSAAMWHLTMMVTVSVENAVIASRVRLESGNAATFTAFLKDELFLRLETPKKLVSDNVKFHHSPQVVQTVQKSPHTLIYLPPYTPEFKLAEQSFGAVRHYIGKVELHNQTTTSEVLNKRLQNITRQQTEGWFREVQRWIAAGISRDLMRRSHDAPIPARDFDSEHSSQGSLRIASQSSFDPLSLS